MVEPRRIKSIDMPMDTPSNRTYEEEVVFMKKLYSESPKKLCRYTVYKIFHYIRIIHEISLLVFSVDFIENIKSDWPAVDGKIYKIFSHRKELKSMPSKDDIIPPAEVIAKKIQKLQDEINQETAGKDGIAQATFLTQKAIEDDMFYQAVEKMNAESDNSEIAWLSKVPIKRPTDGSMKNEKFEEYIKFKQLLQAEFGKNNIYSTKMENKKKINRMIDHTNMVFQQINPGMPKALSAVVTAPNYTFDAAYKKYSMQPTPKIRINSELADDRSNKQIMTDDMRSASVSRRDNNMRLNLDSILEKQQTLMTNALSSSRNRPAKQNSGLSFLHKKSRSLIPENLRYLEDSITNTGRSIQHSDKQSAVKKQSFLPILAISYQKRSQSMSYDGVRPTELVDAIQQQIRVARDRHSKTLQRKQHIIMSMKLSQGKPQKNEEQVNVNGIAKNTKFKVGELKMADKLECMKECGLDPGFWSWEANLPETTGKSSTMAVMPGNSGTRQLLRTRPERSDVGLRFDNTATRLRRTGHSDIIRKKSDKGYIMQFIM